MKTFSYLAACLLLSVPVAQAQTLSKPVKLANLYQIAQQKPHSRDFPSFFETGRVRSEDRLLFQAPRDETIPVTRQSRSWQFIIFKAGGVSFWMPPGILTEETVTLDTRLGNVSFRTLASNAEDSRFVVAYADNLTAEQLTSPEVLLEAIRDRVAPEGKFELKQDRSITLESHPGRELTFENTEEIITFRVYIVGNRLYALGNSVLQANPLPRQTRAFLNAFELLN